MVNLSRNYILRLVSTCILHVLAQCTSHIASYTVDQFHLQGKSIHQHFVIKLASLLCSKAKVANGIILHVHAIDQFIIRISCMTFNIS